MDRTIQRCNFPLGLDACQGLYGDCTKWVISFLNSPYPKHTFVVLLALVQTLYRRSIRREIARNYMDRTIRCCNFPLGLEACYSLYGVCTKWVVCFWNSAHPRHSFGVLLRFVQTLYRRSIRRDLARKYIDHTIQSAICGLVWRPVKVCTVFAPSVWFDFWTLHILGILLVCYLRYCKVCSSGQLGANLLEFISIAIYNLPFADKFGGASRFEWCLHQVGDLIFELSTS